MYLFKVGKQTHYTCPYLLHENVHRIRIGTNHLYNKLTLPKTALILVL